MQVKRVHRHRVQLLAKLIWARIMVIIMGRGTGKSYGITGEWLLQTLLAMPKAVGGLILPSYTGMEKITSEIYKCWSDYGYEYGTHYVFDIKPPAHWPRGYNAPKRNFSNYVSFYNGAGFYYLSSKVPHNGSNLDFLAVEEGKLIPGERYREISLAVRGNEDKPFAKHSAHGSILVVSDQPRPGDEDWFLHWAEKHDPQAVEMILTLQKRLQQTRQELVSATRQEKKKLEKKIEELEDLLNEIRKFLIFYQEADSLENIYALGFGYFHTQAETLDPYDFAVSILNIRPKKVKGGFYAKLMPKVHGYNMVPLAEVNDCRKDSDLIKSQALEVACDYNAAICCMAIGQRQGDTARLINNLDVMSPKFLADLADKFADYYQYMENRVVIYHFDPTALQGRNAVSEVRFYEEFSQKLRARGFIVVLRYHKQTVTYAERYKFFLKLFGGTLPVDFEYNRANCKWWEEATLRAKAGQDNNGKILKLKNEEKSSDIDQRLTTHNTEAFDTLMLGMLYHGTQGHQQAFEDVN